ncbi:hypothetical protein LOTGIDRAFT_120180 [Lottia gigantea]|uniref:DOMON domain-containing protein n=1 Tax=Lottia gigantea TaxID=225164 RepID=V3ZMZ1_LOTGI|nr:hypothetical protein LOTGIDRAFT_120180 [Lottia gigantea]ESO92748.1 hypothetical protein LOTGIDRAFT_120180 [Lottia gigantea]
MEGYKYHVMLDMKSKLMLCWNVFYENKTVSFRITCQLPPDYWFGVGFSGYGEVTNADFVVFWNDPVKTHHLQDSWTDDKGALHSDKSQDYYLNKARTEHGLSILEFSRPFDSCDDHDYLLDNGTTHVVYFTSKGTPSSCIGKDVRQLRHGFQRVQLLKPDVNLPSLPSDVWTFDITAPKVHVPGVETTYWWYITTLPKLNHKQHIVRYEGIIQKENEGIVHHIEVFHCFGNNPVKPYSGPKVPEGKMDPNSDLARCKNVMGAWAMGAEPIIYPEEAGSPIGGKDFSHYVLLEVHFHNPHLQTGHVDSSGIRFYVTPTLRQYDMGIMELGLEYTDKMVIPPGEDRFTLSGYCIADCTQMALPKDGINIFASQLHTHLTGKRVWTKHVRNGLELPEVNRDNHYSPHFQEVRVLRRPINILPGDALITECEDSTVDRRNVTFGGFSITEEMCVNYIHYYPKVNLEVCKSSISYDSLYNFFYFMKRMESVDIVINEGIKYNYNSIPWLPINVHLLDYVYQTSPISMQCNQSDGHRFPVSSFFTTYTFNMFTIPR